MNTRKQLTILGLAVASVLSPAAFAQQEIVEFDEIKVLIEINATDGDVGFHALADTGAWRWMRVDDPTGMKILEMRAHNGLRAQGLTENFFESAEPLCEPDEEEPDELVVTLAEFLPRFPEGTYLFRANTNDGNRARGEGELTYNIPAAPDISDTEDMELPLGNAVIMWSPGDDLGEACSDEDLVADGTIADPATVEVVGWEVVVEVAEPDDEEDEGEEKGEEIEVPEDVFVAQLPPDQTMVTVPVEYLQPILDAGFTEFKFEVGAIEESGNQTFSEGTFEIAD